jgi:hypothetical protein
MGGSSAFRATIAELKALANVALELDKERRTLSNAFDRGPLPSEEQSRIADARLAIAHDAVRRHLHRLRIEHLGEWNEHLNDMIARLNVLAAGPESERFAARASLTALEAVARNDPAPSFAVAYAEALPILHEHRRLLDAVLDVRKRRRKERT